ncbi:aromatic prenyltransferase [Streptomyces sp. NPDC048514]|uniref:aromatic prenyltransferase n=1 Tax=Streptomyces sp. NPDC048514 TaxID=3365564 RepID=UPI003718E5E9
MPEVTVAEDVYSAIEEASQLVGAPCSRENVWPILTAYGDTLAEAGIVFSVSSGKGQSKELDYTITVPSGVADPYAVARSNGFVEETDHPVGTLLSDIQARVPVSEHLIDCEVVSGFGKIYAHFPHDLQAVAKLAAIPSMPASVAENADLFARHHLNDVAMIGIDYRRKTVNLYFAQLPAECTEAENILSLHRELGLPEPGERMLAFAGKSFRVYVTLGWDSAEIERICFAPPPVRNWDPSILPAAIEPDVEKFVANSPRSYAGDPIVISAVKWDADGSYLNIGPYYQLSPMMRKLWLEVYGERV